MAESIQTEAERVARHDMLQEQVNTFTEAASFPYSATARFMTIDNRAQLMNLATQMRLDWHPGFSLPGVDQLLSKVVMENLSTAKMLKNFLHLMNSNGVQPYSQYPLEPGDRGQRRFLRCWKFGFEGNDAEEGNVFWLQPEGWCSGVWPSTSSSSLSIVRSQIALQVADVGIPWQEVY